MENADHTRPTLHPPADGMTWAYLAHHMRLHGSNFVPPPHLRGLPLEYVERKAREEGRAEREAREARESAERIESAPQSIHRALLDGPSSPAMKARPAQRGWRLRVRYLNQLRRCGSFREAAARVGVDESTVRRWRRKYPGFGRRCDEVIAERHREHCDDLRLRAGEPRRRPYFFRGKQVGEHVEHDDRALMFLLKLEDAARARAEAREERREQRAHELRLRELEIEAKKAEARPDATPEMPAPAAHPAAPADEDSSVAIKDLGPLPADSAPPQVVEVAPPPHPASPPRGGEEPERNGIHVPLPLGERPGEGE